jgi:hypothetical protein
MDDRFDRERTVKIIAGWRLRAPKSLTSSAVKVVFFLASNSGREACPSFSNLSPVPCELTGDKPNDSYGFVGLHDLAGIISPRAHSQHAIVAVRRQP